MLDGKRNEDWSHTAWIAAYIASSAFGQKHAVQPQDCNAYLQMKAERKPAKLNPQQSIELINRVFG